MTKGQKISIACAYKDVTYTELAKRMNIHKNTLSLYLNGKSSITDEFFCKALDCLELTDLEIEFFNSEIDVEKNKLVSEVQKNMELLLSIDMTSSFQENATFAQKVRMSCAYLEITKTELARRLGKVPAHFMQQLKEDRFTNDDMNKIAEALGAQYCSYIEFPDGTKF